MSADPSLRAAFTNSSHIPSAFSSVAYEYPHTLSEDVPASSLYSLSPRIITLKPTPAVTTPSPPPVLPAVAKRVADRPKVTVPLYLLVILYMFAFGALIAVAYLLFRRRVTIPFPFGEKKVFSLHGTVLDVPVGTTPAKIPPTELYPAVHFPKALEKKYLNPEFIGEGGLARVFRAERLKDGVIVAVKVPIRFDEVTGTHFTRDILFWQDLRHKNIIRVFKSNILPLPYIEMEYARTSLAGMRFPVSEKEACTIILGVAEGLAYAHEHGIAHRDIKPENILITDDGIPKITDWGLGKSITDTKQSQIIGYSPAYAAPEQLAPHLFGRPGLWTDIYQSGVLFFEMLIGATPFEQEGIQDMNRAILYEKPQIPGWGGEHEDAIRKILIKCLEKNPADRYDSVNSLLADLAMLDGIR